MRIIQYSADQFATLQQATAHRGPGFTLQHRPFVDYYFTQRDSCRLMMATLGDGTVAGTMGGERMRFVCGGEAYTITFLRDFLAFRPGAGLYLFTHWMKLSDGIALAYGGTDDFHNIAKARGWRYFDGIHIYQMNEPYERYAGEPRWHLPVKSVLDRVHRRPIGRYANRYPAPGARIRVREEAECTADMLPARSPFAFRFAPDAEYVNWRYNTRVPFVRYRIFRILDGERTAGYVILCDAPKRIVVSHCDAEDVETLGLGVLRAILEVGKEDREPRTILLSCAHPALVHIYEQFGFHRSPSHRPFTIGGVDRLRGLNPDPSSWLVNYDWGNNILRGPFLGQASDPAAGAAHL